MQLSEFHQSTTKGKVESAQTKMTNCSSDLSLVMPDQDLVELLWENGQIVMQGQSNRPKKIPFANFSTHTTKLQDRETRDVVLPKFSPFGSTDSMVNINFAPAVPSAPMGLNAQNDDMTPWMDYQIEESDYCSEFLSELTGVHLNPHSSTHSHTVPADRISGLDQTHNVEEQWHASSKALAFGSSEPSRIRTSHLFQSRASEFGIEGGGSSSSSSTHKAPCVNLQKQDVGTSKPPPLPRSSGMGLMNFSHFSRPAARVRSNLLNVDRLRSHEKASTAMESTMINSTSGFKSLSTVQSQSASFPPKMELRPSAKPLPEVLSVVRESVRVHQEESSRNIPPDPANGHSSNAKADNGPVAAVASSSVCSVNSVGPVGAESNDPKLTSKRKNREGEESGYQSEDLEDESVDLKKPSTARTSTNVKRSRAAEVHNLSERRRRDRINEKMRALQELIPNCNKVDKASMLDEAIEYLKTLQLQVQIMSMGSGLCMPPMMMQHLRPPHMAHFSPMGMNMGMGMGMGLGYGMGGLDMNGSPGCPVFPVPPMRGPQQFPCTSMPGLHGMPGANSLQMYGIPGQGLPLSMPRAPRFCSMSGLSAQVNLMHQMSVAATNPLPVADTAHPSSSSKDQNPHNM